MRLMIVYFQQALSWFWCRTFWAEKPYRTSWGSKERINSFLGADICWLIKLSPCWLPLLLEGGGNYGIHKMERFIDLMQTYRKATLLPSPKKRCPVSSWRHEEGKDTVPSLDSVWIFERLRNFPWSQFLHGSKQRKLTETNTPPTSLQ